MVRNYQRLCSQEYAKEFSIYGRNPTIPPKVPNDAGLKIIIVNSNYMKFVYPITLAMASFIGFAGCKKEEEVVIAPPPPVAPAVNLTAAPPTPATPAPDAAPPPTLASAPAIPEAEMKLEDGEGKPLALIDFLNLAASNYERTRAGMTEGNPWPPLTDLNQLVQYRVIKRLPAAPEGYKFVFNAETRKVTVAPK